MITEEQITIGTNRLDDGKLKTSDVETMVSTMRSYLGYLEQSYNWTFYDWFAGADDTALKASKIAAVMNLIEDDQFGVAELKNSRGANFSQEEQIKAYCIWILGLFTTVPHELSKYDLDRKMTRRQSTSTDVKYVL